MQLEEQVVSLELAKRLKELGIGQESYFYWYNDLVAPRDGNNYLEWYVSPTAHWEGSIREYSAFTVAELGEQWAAARINGHQLQLISWKGARSWYAEDKHNVGIPMVDGPTEAEARAKMLIYLLEHELLALPNTEQARGRGGKPTT